jgi:DNA-binding beta-propeller fold protein YncE
MNFGQAHVRLVQTGAVFAVTALVAGCGNNYRSTVTSTTSSGPASQVVSYAVVLSAPAPTATTDGIVTIIDYSGDTKMAVVPIGPGPAALAMDAFGTDGYTINSNGTIYSFPTSKSLKQADVVYTTLPSTADPVNLYMSISGLWAADLDGNVADAFTGSPETFLSSIPLAPTPVTLAGSGAASQKVFAISQGNSAGDDVTSPVQCNVSPTTAPLGEADVIEVASYSISNTISLGKCPVYALENSSVSRLFVLNRGSDTITVINAKTGMLNSCTPFVDSNTGRTVTCHSTLPLSTAAVTATGITPTNGVTDSGLTATAGPVYAEYNVAKSLLVVANYDGGTISIIDVSMDEWGNDSANFGTTYTVPVGKNPAGVTVLYDGSRAYTANQADQTVSIVYLSSHTVEKTLSVTGHPRNVASTQNSNYGKVYVASPDTNVLTIISTGGTDIDSVDTTALIDGNVVDVRTTTQNGLSGNNNTMSRRPGYGQPCNLPLSEYDPASSSDTAVALANCRVQDTADLQ